MKTLFLLRGLPGSGKSTLAKSIGGAHFEADMYFIRDGVYQFDPTSLSAAHAWCLQITETALKNESPEKIIVSNTFTQDWELASYYALAKKYNCQVFSIIVENRHGGVNEHGCPEDKVEIMRNRFEIKL